MQQIALVQKQKVRDNTDYISYHPIQEAEWTKMVLWKKESLWRRILKENRQQIPKSSMFLCSSDFMWETTVPLSTANVGFFYLQLQSFPRRKSSS